MKKSTKIAISIVIPISIGLGVGTYYFYKNYNHGSIDNSHLTDNIQNLKIASWNLQIFGEKKAHDPQLLKRYANVMTNYNIIFVEEIRDSSETAISSLASLLDGYEHIVSSRSGRSNSKEQYGVFFQKDKVKVKEVTDYNPDVEDRWERPPIKIVFNSSSNYTLSVFAIHTKPSDVKNELSSLEKIVINSGNTLVLGDLNASGNYYNHSRENDFKDWDWIIKDGEDTTVSIGNSYTYDRIIANADASKEILNHGVFTNGIDSSLSDHYPVWVEIIPIDK